ncbi:MAG: ATP-binding cassette domain-containing protein [Bacteroidales bacterium]|nr:ATP-binding cassette domain-containing protein [Bacteroidales bacterium]
MEEVSPLDTIIELKSCSVMQQDHLVLSDVNLKADKGEFIYLVGRVGSGKTSLIRTLNAQLPLTDGEGWVAGFNLRTIRNREIPLLRRKLGIVFQDFQLLNDRSVHDNLEFALRATGWTNRIALEDRIREVLEKVNLHNKGFKMPHQLSGGEQQRVVIARALLNDPEIILADEPTGNLDPETSEDIHILLRSISDNGRAVIMSTHKLALVKKYPARTVRCEDGKLTETGLDDQVIELLF